MRVDVFSVWDFMSLMHFLDTAKELTILCDEDEVKSSKRGDDIDQGSLMYFAQFCQQTFRPEKIYVKDGLSQREIFFGKMISKISKRRWFFPKWKTQQKETKRGLYSELFK
ncbi:unnamed protein product [Oikopleura dioica]|uniref:Uncharacterized protein n=1 Tax=Oikopleura dioica TaxID=34765 RepID=E4WVM7_OIKDI|nr:unnamed protein product [Oikopleura dioica]